MWQRLTAGLVCAALLAGAAAGPKKLPKPGMNFFSPQQDIELGREYSKQIEQQLPIVNDKELTAYVNRVGQRLVTRGGVGEWPFFFKVVNDPAVNAFALPGGPMYVNTGLIKAVDNEAQLASVLAHEVSHVALRHGTNQVSKQNLIQLPAIIGGAMAGGGMAGALAQLGIGLTANSALLKFSRGAEADADLLGMHVLARAGYNPIEMARMFEKLQEGAHSGGKMAEFFSSHPNPENRVKNIEEQVRYVTPAAEQGPEGDLTRMKKIVAGLPAAPKRTQQSAQNGQSAPGATTDQMPQVTASNRFREYRSTRVTFSYPENWQVTGSAQSLTIAPPEGIVKGQGNPSVGFGILLSGAELQRAVDLQRDTQQLLQQLAQQNQGMKSEGPSQQVTIDGSQALVTRLTSDAPYRGMREVDTVVTIDRGNALVYLICIAPQPEYSRLEPVFQQIVNSMRFSR